MIEKRNLIHSQFVWDIVADELSAAGWSWGYGRAVTQHGRQCLLSVTNRPLAVDV
jgi:hypothetical protein